MKRLLVLISLLLTIVGGSAYSATLVNNPIGCTGSSCTILLQPKTSGGAIGTTFTFADGKMSSTGVVTQGVCSKSANYTITDVDGCYLVLVTTGASTITITLPAASTNAGRSIVIKKVDNGAGKITITRAGSDTVEGWTSSDLGVGSANQGSYIAIDSDGSSTWKSLGASDVFTSSNTPSASTSTFTASSGSLVSTVTLTTSLPPGTWHVSVMGQFDPNVASVTQTPRAQLTFTGASGLQGCLAPGNVATVSSPMDCYWTFYVTTTSATATYTATADVTSYKTTVTGNITVTWGSFQTTAFRVR